MDTQAFLRPFRNSVESVRCCLLLACLVLSFSHWSLTFTFGLQPFIAKSCSAQLCNVSVWILTSRTFVVGPITCTIGLRRFRVWSCELGIFNTCQARVEVVIDGDWWWLVSGVYRWGQQILCFHGSDERTDGMAEDLSALPGVWTDVRRLNMPNVYNLYIQTYRHTYIHQIV